MATAVGGTPPTAMHSCLHVYFSNLDNSYY